MSPAIKLEGDELMDDFPLFPGFFDAEKENDIQEEFVLDTDSLALKGQVWPGMGKMDLADEAMRRNRNQKKPKCVIDRMKRASERIEPTQVIMTSELEVKRTKDVYDDTSSPVPGQEDSVCTASLNLLHANWIRHHHERLQRPSARSPLLLQRCLETFLGGESLPVVRNLPQARRPAPKSNRATRRNLKLGLRQTNRNKHKMFFAMISIG